jgi:ATP-dependent phosphoenolpyruvate carboxykinase
VAYEDKARELADMFAKNFDRFAAEVPPEVVRAGPTSSA